MKFGGLILSNLLRKKLRLALTVGSFAVALFLFAMLAVVRGAFSRGTDIAGADRLIVINRVSIVNPLPISYQDKIQRIPGIAAVTHYNWFGGVYQDEKNFFPQFVIDPENQRRVRPELTVPDDQWRAFAQDRQGAVVGAKTAQRFGWKIGDRIPIKNIAYGAAGTWEFNLDGIYHAARPGGDERQFWFQWSYFQERVPQEFKGNVGWYAVKLDNAEEGARIAKAIDDQFANSSFETKAETESAFAANWVKQLGNIEALVASIGAVVFFTLLLVTGNTMAISVRERGGELAVLKAIGFSDLCVLVLVLAESLIIAVSGGLLGLGLGLLAVPRLSAALNGMLPELILSPGILVDGLATALVIGLVSGFLPGIGATRMRVVTALRRV